MKTVIKGNWFKISIMSAILLCGLIFLFYLQILQKEARQKQFLESSIKCSQDGLTFFDNYKIQNGGYSQDGHTYSYGNKWYDPIYHFNKKLNTCLVLIGYQSSSHATHLAQDIYVSVWDGQHNEVTDIYSNKILVSSDHGTMDVEDAQFQQQVKLLMNE